MTRAFVRLVGITALVTMIAGGATTTHSGMIKEKPGDHPLPCAQNPMMALQCVETRDAAETVVRDLDDEDRAHARMALAADYGFIGGYALLFALGSRMIVTRRLRRGAAIALAVVVLGLAAAAADVWENRGIAAMIAGADVGAVWGRVTLAASIKWALTFVVTGLMAAAFFGRGPWIRVIAWLLIAGALLGLIALVFKPAAIALAMLFVMLALAMLTLISLTYPESFATESSTNAHHIQMDR